MNPVRNNTDSLGKRGDRWLTWLVMWQSSAEGWPVFARSSRQLIGSRRGDSAELNAEPRTAYRPSYRDYAKFASQDETWSVSIFFLRTHTFGKTVTQKLPDRRCYGEFEGGTGETPAGNHSGAFSFEVQAAKVVLSVVKTCGVKDVPEWDPSQNG